MVDPANPYWDALWAGTHLATLTADAGGYGEIRDDAIAIKNGRIARPGYRADLPVNARATQEHDDGGAWLTPGLVGYHTYLVYVDNRSNGFEARLNSVPYEKIARAGGDILSTVRATRAASEDTLAEASPPRLNALRAEGVTTVEIKSGYDLNLETERRMLRVARRFDQLLPVRVRTTFLGAHTVPPEFAGRADDYIDHFCADVLPALAAESLVDAVDAFCETIGFTPAQMARMFDATQRHGLPVRLHTGQLSDQGDTALVARYGGLPVGYLECLTEAGIAAMTQAGTVAVLLPDAFYCLRETHLPPMAALRATGVPMIVSTDCNPGTSPMSSLLLAMNMVCTLFHLTLLEALTGATRHVAAALGLSGMCGVLAPGCTADFALWHIDRPADLAYAMGLNPCVGVVKDGAVAA